MNAQKTITKFQGSVAFFSKIADWDYRINVCFCARCRNNSSFPFTGKEKDSETGYSYFGARYLEHELISMWLSVDPMSDKYPSISPYAYCAWNPVKLVDPEGCEWQDGDYYTEKGKYIGWDGVDDNNVHIVRDKESIDKITRNDKNGHYTSSSSVTILLTTNYQVIRQVERILNLCIKDNGRHEYSCVMSGYLSSPIIKNERKTGYFPPLLDAGQPHTSIHSHPFSDEKDHWIENMSHKGDDDATAFQNYDLNIIVGERNVGTGYGAAFYSRQGGNVTEAQAPILVLKQEELHRIVTGRTEAQLNRMLRKI